VNSIFLAWAFLRRDARAGELPLLALAIAVAVAALASVGFLSERITQGMTQRANQLLAGDRLLKSDTPWPAKIQTEAQKRGLTLTASALFNSMVSTEEQALLAGIKVVREGYPLRGEVRIARDVEAPESRADGIPSPGEVWVDERLLLGLGLKVGDLLSVGLLELRVAALLRHESDRGTAFFSFLPRLMMNEADLEKAGLLVTGSRADYRLHVIGASDALAGFTEWLTPRLERGQSIDDIGQAQPQVRMALDQAERFLRLAALLAIVLSAVAVGLCAHRFVQRHQEACAVLRCLGARQGQIATLHALELLFLALLASAAGLFVAWLTQFFLGHLVTGVTGEALPPPSWAPVWQGLGLGLILTLGFALPRFLSLAQTPPLRVLRREAARLPPSSLGVWLVSGLAFFALVLWVAKDATLGLGVALGLVLGFGGFAVLARIGLWMLAHMGRLFKTGFGPRHALAALERRKASTLLQITALGLGICALLILTVVQTDLVRSWQGRIPADAPNRFILNILPTQVAPLSAFFESQGFGKVAMYPMIRGRLVAINDVPVNPDAFEEARAQRLARREFNLSFGTQLPNHNTVVSGQWHGATQTGFSVEQSLMGSFSLKLGDILHFDVAGQRITAPITSFRELDWDSMQVNFFVIASPDLFAAHAPTLITSLHWPEEKTALIPGVVRDFPNLTLIDVEAIVRQIESVFGELIKVVQAVFVFALLAGMVVLFSALQATHDERAHEQALLRTLGARKQAIMAAFGIEFGICGLLTGLLAGLGAVLAGSVLATGLFKIEDYSPSWWAVPQGMLAGVLLIGLAGFWQIRILLAHPPLWRLRAL
jgi:putative ABC transport system permease protein